MKNQFLNRADKKHHREFKRFAIAEAEESFRLDDSAALFVVG